jgi:Uma2 family endonuclease
MSLISSFDVLTALPPVVPEVPIRRLSVAEYHQMLRAGILTEDDAVELLEGWLVPKMTKHPPHRAATRLTRVALEKIVPAAWYVDSQEPVTTDDSEPEPDVSVIRGQTRDYLARHPGPTDIGLVVEVADESLARDRGVKKRLYARARVPRYWIVNLIDRQVEVYSDPTGAADEPDFRDCRVYREGDEVPVVLDGMEVGRIAVRELLP